MSPGDAAFCVFVFDAVAGVGVVFHYFACADLAVDVDLEEDCVSGAGYSYFVAVDESVNGFRIEYGSEKGNEVAVDVVADGAGDYALRQEAEFLGCSRWELLWWSWGLGRE